MDTRTKIISFDHALAIASDRPVRWITGHFDPMLAEHARRVHELVSPGELAIVVVTNPAEPLLPLRARAELVAALADVDYVVMKDGPTPSLEPEDERITQAFVERVMERQRSR